jgi:GNAT superfamily N-acetyltransferase
MCWDKFVNHQVGLDTGPGRAYPLRAGDTPHMELRAARVGDTNAIVAMDPGRLGTAGHVEALIQERHCLVTVERGEITGFLVLRPGHFYGRDFIDVLYVAPHRRRQGAGRALMRTAVRNAATARVFVSTNESNTPMRTLLRSEGWTPSGVLTGLDEGDPEHVFFHDVPQASAARPRY